MFYFNSNAPPTIAPPLPLLRFSSGSEVQSDIVRTISGEKITSVPNDLSMPNSRTVKLDKLQNPIIARNLAKVFGIRTQREVNFRHMEAYNKTLSDLKLDGGNNGNNNGTIKLQECIVYESSFFNESRESRLDRRQELLQQEQFFLQQFSLLNANIHTQNQCPSGSSYTVVGRSSSANDCETKSDIEKKIVAFDDDLAVGNEPSDNGNVETITNEIFKSSISEKTFNNDSQSTFSLPTIGPSLIFDSEFECGNMERAVRVFGRESLLNIGNNSHGVGGGSLSSVHHEYDLTLRNDLNTEGNIQWYYFSVDIPHEYFPNISSSSNSENHIINPSKVDFDGLKVRFNIINMQKKDSLYNYGMKPAYCFQSYSQETDKYNSNKNSNNAENSSNSHFGNNNNTHSNSNCANSSSNNKYGDWSHGGYDICYYKNGQSSVRLGKGKKKVQAKQLYTLTFSFNFTQPGKYYFAYCFPYTYSDLQRQLNEWELDETISKYMHRRTLCETLAGNKCEVLTITDRGGSALESRNRPSVIVCARVHPGESVSSFMVHGLIDFLCSENVEAQRLRRAFVFTILPMLNPDGVIHGNYRCSLAGTDLNRRYLDAHPSVHPTIVAAKSLFKNIAANRPVLMFLDLHGHSKLKNCFLYGCDPLLQPEKQLKLQQTQLQQSESVTKEQLQLQRVFCRLFPKILCSVSRAAAGGNNGLFSFRDCSFKIDKSKMGTGRVVCWRDLGVLASYTVEASFCSIGDNDDVKLLKKYDAFAKKQQQQVPSNLTATLPSTTSSNPVAAAPAEMQDTQWQRLQDNYSTAVHFTKRDFFLMGRQLCTALYHFANLSHADLDYELELLQRHDANVKDRDPRELLESQLHNAPPLFRHAAATTSTSTTSSTSVNYVSGATVINTQNNVTMSNSFNYLSRDFTGTRGVAAMDNDETDSICSAEALDDNDDNDENETDDNDPLADEDNRQCSGSNNNSNTNNSVVPQYLQTRIEQLDSTMTNRSCARVCLFSAASLQHFARCYPAELQSLEKSTMNVSLRAKCELGLRRALHVEDKLLTEAAIVAIDRRDFEEKQLLNGGNDDDSGSDSCPSDDNRRASSLLTLLAKQSSSSSNVMAALRHAMVRNQQKEAMKKKKAEVAAQKRLAKQAKRLAVEQQLQQQQQAEENNPPTRPSTAKPSANSSNNNNGETRTIVLPRFSPAYRHDTKAQIVPVQIKIVNFRPMERRPLTGRDRGSANNYFLSTSNNNGNNSNNPSNKMSAPVSATPPIVSPVASSNSSNNANGANSSSRYYRLSRPTSAQPMSSSQNSNNFSFNGANRAQMRFDRFTSGNPLQPSTDTFLESLSSKAPSNQSNLSNNQSNNKAITRKSFYG